MPNNLFRQALEILNAKNGERTEGEQGLLNAALIPLNIHGCRFPEDMTISECLEELAKIVDEDAEERS